MKPRCTIAAIIAISAVAVGAVGVSAGQAPHAERDGADLADVRRATARYHDESRARRDGYVPTGTCAQLPGAGANGRPLHQPATCR